MKCISTTVERSAHGFLSDNQVYDLGKKYGIRTDDRYDIVEKLIEKFGGEYNLLDHILNKMYPPEDYLVILDHISLGCGNYKIKVFDRCRQKSGAKLHNIFKKIMEEKK